VFDPFFTTKGEGKGTGLGLSQVHGFAHQSGGSVVINSDMGQGTRVTLYLPRATTETASEPVVAVQKTSSAGCSVLVVEDNPEVAEVTSDLLARMGCDAVVVSDVPAALALLEGKQFDIVLSDIVMAGAMNGLDLARTVRQRWPDMRMVLTTGYSEAAAEATKEFTVLRKPYQVEDLGQAFAPPRTPGTVASAKVLDFQGNKRARGPKAGETPNLS
jgi:CheY-like chemotaxis protein